MTLRQRSTAGEPPPAPAGGPGPPAGAAPWPARRVYPLLAALGLIVFCVASTTWWGPALLGRAAWSLPGDLWATLAAAQRLVHGDLAGLYTPPTRLVTFPGAAVILMPLAALADAAGLSLAAQGPHNLHPAVWLLAGPYQVALSAVALFAADALAERLGAGRARRAALAAAGAVALWSVSVRWGHPEDAVAVGLFLYAVLALARPRTAPARSWPAPARPGSAPARPGTSPAQSRTGPARPATTPGRPGVALAGWLTGAAIAVQPLVLLALPVVAVVIEPRRLAGFLARAAAPGVALLGAASAANWQATVHAVTSQPNWVTIDQATPWAALSPHTGSGESVAAGPFRVLAIAVACACALAAGRRWRAARHAPSWDEQTLAEVLWWIALALALRSVFEPVMVAYYLWPALAVALIPAARNRSRLTATALAATAVTLVSQLTWRGPWAWWAPMVAGVALTLFFARTPVTAAPSISKDPLNN